MLNFFKEALGIDDNNKGRDGEALDINMVSGKALIRLDLAKKTS